MEIKNNYSLREISGFTPRQVHVIGEALRSIHGNTDVDFDFPDYAGLPPKIFEKFTSDQVDALQDLLWDSHPPSDNDILDALLKYGLYN